MIPAPISTQLLASLKRWGVATIGNNELDDLPSDSATRFADANGLQLVLTNAKGKPLTLITRFVVKKVK